MRKEPPWALSNVNLRVETRNLSYFSVQGQKLHLKWFRSWSYSPCTVVLCLLSRLRWYKLFKLLYAISIFFIIISLCDTYHISLLFSLLRYIMRWFNFPDRIKRPWVTTLPPTSHYSTSSRMLLCKSWHPAIWSKIKKCNLHNRGILYYLNR